MSMQSFTDEELAALAQGMRDLSARPGHLAVTADRLHDEAETEIERREGIGLSAESNNVS